jgi:hypothetical protein
MESRRTTLDAPAEDWAEVERWSLRAQALAELRTLSDPPEDHGPAERVIRIP